LGVTELGGSRGRHRLTTGAESNHGGAGSAVTMRIFRPKPSGGTLLHHGCSLRSGSDRLGGRAAENLCAIPAPLVGVDGDAAPGGGGGLQVRVACGEVVSLP